MKDILSIAKVVEQPRKPDCPNRTITCKFDGTCDKYEKFDLKVKELRDKRHEEQKKKNTMLDYRRRTRKNFNSKYKADEI